MKITSLPKKWKVGDILFMNLLRDLVVGRVVQVRNDGVNYKIITGEPSIFELGLFDFRSIAFEENKIFRFEDNRKRAFDLIFK